FFHGPRVGEPSRDEMLGPRLCRIYERSAIGPLRPTAPARLSFGVFAAAHRRFSAAGCAGLLGQTTISALRAGRAHPERARSPLLRTTLLWRLPQSNWPTTEFRNWRQTDRQNSMSLLHNAAVFCLCSALRAAQNWHSESL